MFEGQDITRLAPDSIVRTGLIQVPEGRRIFANMSVHENLELGAYTRKDRSGIKAIWKSVYAFSPLKGAHPSNGRHAFRRRTANACYGARSYVEAQAAPAR